MKLQNIDRRKFYLIILCLLFAGAAMLLADMVYSSAQNIEADKIEDLPFTCDEVAAEMDRIAREDSQIVANDIVIIDGEKGDLEQKLATITWKDQEFSYSFADADLKAKLEPKLEKIDTSKDGFYSYSDTCRETDEKGEVSTVIFDGKIPTNPSRNDYIIYIWESVYEALEEVKVVDEKFKELDVHIILPE